MRATARHNKLLNSRFWQHEAVQGLADRERGEDCSCADEIVGLGALAAAEGEEFLYVSMAEVFAASGFGWCKLQIGIA